VRCGDAWRPIDAPQMPGEQAGADESFAFFAPRIAGAAAATGPAEDESLKPLLTKLRDIESRLATAGAAARNDLLSRQIAVLEEVRTAAAGADKTFWTKQLAETLAAAVQDATVPEGLGKLETIAAEVAGDEETAAFVAFRLAQARYAAGMQQSGADVEKVQTAWIEELGRFVEQHPRAADAAEAMLQLGIADEFSGREKEALDRYGAIVKDFPDAAPARKARGAARRLESVGKPLSLTGTSLDGKQFSLESLRGTPVLVHYWATWCEPCKVDIAQIRELYAKYGSRKFAVVGVTLDSDRGDLVKFLQAKPIPWPQLYEKGGFDGRLAEELGVLTLPTMLLIDAEGRVVDRNLVITDLEKKLEQLLEGK
jgi:thiol-disulfide isomerase/thioredoxin